MGKEDTKLLVKFSKPFPEKVKETAFKLREFVWDLYPECNELIYDNYNALAIGFSTSDRVQDVFCSIAVYSKYVNFGFNRGSEIDDPEKKFKGNGSLYRYIRVEDFDDFPRNYIKKLMRKAYENSSIRLKGKDKKLKGLTIVKSISPVKRRPK